ncbi:MAG TPA: hypothetical protein VGV64_02215 [Thermoplasmata archaeon]|nr:hypothetical protein [Thermoplasmata archaeon]HEV2428645.1 hypothetical protein [Thermoplasmata archaeon]
MGTPPPDRPNFPSPGQTGYWIPPPPPPPPGFGPSGGGQWPLTTPPPPGASAIEAMTRIETSLTYYWVSLLLGGLGAAVSLALVGSLSPGGIGSFGPSLSSHTTPVNALTALAVGAIAGLFSLIALVFVIIAWLTWRSGVNELAGAALEYGPSEAGIADRARRDVLYVLAIFLTELIVGAGIGVAIFLASFVPQTNLPFNRTPMPVTTISPPADLPYITAGWTVVAVGLQLTMYFLALRGLSGALTAVRSNTPPAELEADRTFVLVGALLSVFGILLLVPSVWYVGALGLLSPLVLLYGFYRIRSRFSAWIRAPVRPYSPWSVPPGRAP